MRAIHSINKMFSAYVYIDIEGPQNNLIYDNNNNRRVNLNIIGYTTSKQQVQLVKGNEKETGKSLI